MMGRTVLIDGKPVSVWSAKEFDLQYKALLEVMSPEEADHIMAGAVRIDACEVAPVTPQERQEQHQDRVKAERKEAGQAKQSSYQRLLAAMPPTARKLYQLGRELATLNPTGRGVFDLGARDGGKRLGCDPTTANDHMRLHQAAGVWKPEGHASFRGRKAQSWRLVPLSDIDFEAAVGVYQGYREQMRARVAGLGDAPQTPHATCEDAPQDAPRTPHATEDAPHTK